MAWTRATRHVQLARHGSSDAPMDLRLLRAVTILGPIAFVVALDMLGVLVLKPLTGHHELLWLAIVCVVLVVAVVPFSVWVFGVIQRQQQQLQNWNDHLESIVAERTRQIERYNREMTTRVLRAQEEERKRIARELHDDTAQSLSSMLISMDLLEPHLEGTDAAVRAGFDRVRTLTKRTLDEVRTLSHDLRPTILDDFGLSAALRWFADEYEVTFGVAVEVDVDVLPDERLQPETELALFRIAQEALTNSGKYAGATKTCVSLHFMDAAARLVIEDNGRGFSPEDVMGPTREGGLGLYGMRERAELLDGTLSVESAPGKGTRVTATVPIHEVHGIDAASTVTREGHD